ncbi:Glutathione synthetase [Thalassocella blandensis]|nr:Glutathione synthetase [Thalassocella blandensis]
MLPSSNSGLTLGVVMDPIGSITYYKDTTLALLWAAKDAGFNLVYIELSDLYLAQGQARASVKSLEVFENKDKWFQFGVTKDIALSELDVILMRKDPPFDNQYIYATYVLERAEDEGCLVINKPQSLRDCNEKVFATRFPQCCPPVLVSGDSKKLREFHQQHGDVIFKPLDGMGGSGIFRCKADDPNVGVILETLTNNRSEYVMAQKFIPQISSGDKRVLVVFGEAIPYCLARVPAKGETRGNLAAGGTGIAQPLSDRDRWIVEQVAPSLMERGLYFVGLDIIGDYLTEINVTSPTCVREIDKAFDTQIGAKLMTGIQQLLHQRTSGN